MFVTDSNIYAVWLLLKGGATSRRNSVCVKHFGSAKEAFEADENEYIKAGLSVKDYSCYLDKNLDSAENTVIRCNETGINIITFWDENFPEALRHISPAPVLLFVKGNLPTPKSLIIASVGTRKSTPYGEKVAYKLTRLLAESGVTVISGIAKGIDSFSLMGALDGKGKCFSVLGSGVNVCYPKENEDIYNKIISSGGGIISEYPPDTKPLGANFPKRNRIIAGLANGVLIAEAPKSSGALITASYALDYGKDLFAVPGSLFSRQSDGSNMLIRDGKAKLILNHLDILEEYAGIFSINPKIPEKDENAAPKKRIKKKGILKKKNTESETEEFTDQKPFLPANTGNENHNAVLNLLAEKNLSISEIVSFSGLSAAEVASILTVLELDGNVSALPGGYFKRII